MKVAKIFKNGRSQAIRLPKEYRFDGDEVYIKRIEGGILLISKTKDCWDTFIKGVNQFSEDFMSERTQPDVQNRESF